MYRKLSIESRSLDREHKSKNLRKDGLVPGVIFGKEIDSLPIKVPANILNKFLETSGRVFEIEVKGEATHLVNLDNLQWDALGNRVMHVAFYKLKKGHKTTVSIPLSFVGESKGQKDGGLMNFTVDEINIEALPKDIPEKLEVDISSLEIGDSLLLKDLKIPSTLSLVADDLDQTVVSCQHARAEEEEKPSTEEVSPEDTPTVAEQEKTEE